jgi:hypothetical protein
MYYKIEDIYFNWFKKHSSGRKIYGFGFVLMVKHHSFLIGTKKIEYRNSKKNYKDFAKKTWRSKKKFVSYRK